MARTVTRSKSRASHRSILDSSLLESEPVRLQREADLFTSKLEHERRQKVMLDEQLRQLTEELRTKTKEAKAKTPTDSKLTMLKTQIQRLEHKLELALSKTSKTQAENSELRSVIDGFRQDKFNRRSALGFISQDIIEQSQKAEQHYGIYVQGQRQDDLQRSRIYQLRSQSHSEHLKKNERIGELNVSTRQSLIKEDRLNKGIFIRNIEQSFNAQLKKNTETMDPTLVLKKLQLKWGNSVKEKKRQLDLYSKQVRLLGEAVEQIKEATGVPSIEEMTTTFIKSEDQQYSIGTYLNNLHAEVEVMEDSLRTLLVSIKSNSKTSHSTEAEVQSLVKQQRVRCHRLKDSLAKNRGEELVLRQDIEAMKLPLTVSLTQSLLSLFSRSAFELNISLAQPTTEGEQITDDKLLSKLGQLEELLTSLQIYLAMKEGESSPSLKPLDLSSMPERQTPAKLLAHGEIRTLNEILNDTEDEARTPLKLDQLRQRAKSRLSTRTIFVPQGSRESRSFTPQPQKFL
jgi:hypothetical protein